MDAITSYFSARRAVQDDMPDERQHRRELARAVQTLMRGQSNATLRVTLAANAASSVVTDPRISMQTAFMLVPMTADAAAELASGAVYIVPTSRSATIFHRNSTQTERTFIAALIG